MKDKNGIEIKKGQIVDVPEPNETDNYHFEFTGTVVDFHGDYVVVADADDLYFDIEPERLEVDETNRIETTREEIVRVMTNWIQEADSETLVMVFREYFDGKLSYNSETETYCLDAIAGENLGIKIN